MNPRLYDLKFGLAFTSNILFVMANSVLLVHFARYVDFLGGDERDIGWILGIGAVPAVLLRPWIGRWIDRLGPRLTWAIGYGLFILTALTYLVLDRIGPGIYVVRCVAMLAPAISFTSTLAYLSHTTPPRRLAEAIGTLGAAGLVGIAIGPFLGDQFLGQAGGRAFGDFVWLFGTAAALLAVSLVIVPMLRPTPPHPEARRTPFAQALRQYWPGWSLLPCFAFGVCMAVQFGFLAKFTDEEGIGSTGLYFVAYAVWAIILRIRFRRLAEHIGQPRQLVIGMTFWAIGFASNVWVDHAWQLIVPAVLCGTGHALAFPPMTALVLECFPPPLRGTGAAVALMALDAGTVSGSPILGWIAYYQGYRVMFAFAAVFIAVSVVAYRMFALMTVNAPDPPPTTLRDDAGVATVIVDPSPSCCVATAASAPAVSAVESKVRGPAACENES